MNLVKYSELSKNSADKFNFVNPQADVVILANDLLNVVRLNGGLAISAPQVGENLRVIVIDADEPMVLINPQIIECSSKEVDLEETCMTFPHITVKVSRPISIRVRYNQLSGVAKTFTYEGMTARLIQHQLDYLNGYTMLDRISKLKRDMIIKKMNKRI